MKLVFSYSLQEPLRLLYQADCVSRLRTFEIFDPDGGEYGDCHFEMSSDGMRSLGSGFLKKHNSILISLFLVGHDKYFELVKESRNATNLYVKQLLPAGI